MKYILKLSFFIITLCIIGCKNNSEKEINKNNKKEQIIRSTIDFESIDAYYNLLEKLENGEIIKDKDWSNFINLKGNRLYIKENNISNKTIDLIREEMNICYNPQNHTILSDRISNDIRLQIRKRYQSNKVSYLKHIKWLKNNTRVLQDSALVLAKNYLPIRMHQLDTFPNIYFHGLWDGSASNEGIFVDMILQYDFDERRLGSFIAHELHHFMMQSDIDSYRIVENDKGIVWAISSIQTEGVADMVDKSNMIYENSDWWLNDQYMALLNYAGQVIIELDKYIVDEYNNTTHSESEYRQVLQNSVGHIPGQYMAEQIRKNGRLDEVINEINNPFKFFYIYNELAIRNEKTPNFSKKAIEYLKKIERKYITTANNDSK